MTEVKRVKEFYMAEDYHQQYLMKGGQNAKQGADEAIRCYG
jgi:peptide-methionine (S)-S-oxide reductase